MTSEPARFKQIEELYHAVHAQPASARAEMLARATAGDEALRREVESLLAHASTADGFLDALLPDGPDSQQHVARGDTLGPYEIVEFVGAGGMGEVYRARDPRLQRDVAIKVLPARSSAPRQQQQLLAEARAAGALNHPNILTVFDVGTHAGAPFIVSELLRGETLRGRLSRGPLAAAEAHAIAAGIVRGLIAAHDEGIVHRDLKPDNVFITADGRVKILDFGLATRTGHSDVGAAAGTVGYMSPEQGRGERTDPRADVFAFGALLQESIAGKAALGPTTEDTAELASLLGIATRCLRDAPDERFQTAREVAEALAAAARARPDPAPVRRARGRRLLISAAAITAAVVLLITGNSTLTQWREVPAVATSPSANEAYMRGRFFLAKSTDVDIQKAIVYFQQASAADPLFALAHAGLADAYTAQRSVYAAPDAVMPKARTAALRAIALDPSLAEAHVSIGGVLMYYDFDWSGAEREFRRAIELSPRLASAHQAYALLLASLGRHAEARAAIDRARELDPLSLQILVDAGWVSYLARDFTQMAAFNQKAIELDGNYSPAYRDLGVAYEKRGHFPEAISLLQKARSLEPNATLFEMLGGAYASAGRRGEARQVLTDLDELGQRQYVCPYEVATVHAGLGDVEATMDWLEKGYQQRADCMPWAGGDSKLDGLRALPRFKDLMRRLGLPSQ